MKINLKHIVMLLGVSLPVAKGYSQQNIQFTQYIFNSISVNPAYTGYKEEWFGQIGMRSQWTGWEGAPKTGSISIDGVLDPVQRRHGVGLQVTGDQLGAQAATSLYANYALRLQLDEADEHRLALGVAGGVSQYSLDGNKLEYVDAGDIAIPTGKISTWKPDIRLGVYYSNSRWYAGVSVHDLFSGTNSNEDFQFNQNSLESLYRNTHGYFITGALFDLDPGLKLRPSIMVKDDFKGPTSLDVNAMLIFNNKFWLGASYRTRAKVFKRDYVDYSVHKLNSANSVSGLAQFYVSPKFRLGYSYDYMINSMSGLQNGTHEVTLGVTFGRALRQVLSPRYF
jgi:type IX secretion system PorP/SprF family membrane protein